MRLQSSQNGSFSIAKFCPSGAPKSAFADFKANILGYAGIRKTGAENLLPPGYRVLHFRGTPVIVMDDLGENLFFRLKSDKKTVPRYYKWLCAHSEEMAISTLRKDEEGAYGTESLKEVSKYILWYAEKVEVIAPGISRYIYAILTAQKLILPSSYVTLCLLDFTPSNLFVSKERISFIDPWAQKSYLGNPAISIGQFATLVCDVYCLEGAKKGAEMLRKFALQRFPPILGCTKTVIEHALGLGSALQFLLSAYVRLTEDRARALAYTRKAARILMGIVTKGGNSE